MGHLRTRLDYGWGLADLPVSLGNRGTPFELHRNGTHHQTGTPPITEYSLRVDVGPHSCDCDFGCWYIFMPAALAPAIGNGIRFHRDDTSSANTKARATRSIKPSGAAIS